MSLLPDVELSTKVMTMYMLESLVHIMAIFEIDTGISLIILSDERYLLGSADAAAERIFLSSLCNRVRI